MQKPALRKASLRRLVYGANLGLGMTAGVVIGGLVVLAVANSLEMFLIAAVITTLGSTLNQPALSALAIDLADRGRMGKAMATFSMFYRAGEGLGAPLAGVGHQALVLDHVERRVRCTFDHIHGLGVGFRGARGRSGGGGRRGGGGRPGGG